MAYQELSSQACTDSPIPMLRGSSDMCLSGRSPTAQQVAALVRRLQAGPPTCIHCRTAPLMVISSELELVFFGVSG
jgi:hypothetical protein